MDDTPAGGFRHRPQWLLAVAGLVVAQAGLALALFGPERTTSVLLDDRPVLSGRHPLHLYHGALGSDAFRRAGATTVYDPAFQAGYPKTPVFDGGCRPAELFLVAAGGGYRPAAYKVGLFVCLLLVPPAFVLAGRGAGLPAGASIMAGIGGIVLCWSGPVRGMIEAGEFDFLMAGLAVLIFVPWLGRYARWFGVDSWLVLAAVAAAGWYAHPVVWFGLVPVVVAYYVVVAPRQELAWHLGLAGITVAGIAPNAWWLADWCRYWWLRGPSPDDHIPLPTWEAIAGTPHDYLTLAACAPAGVVLTALGVAGLVGVWRSGHRGAAGLLLVTTLMTLAAARLLTAWPRVPPGAADRLVPLAAGFLAPPVALAGWWLLNRVRLGGPATVAAVLGLVVVGWADGPGRPLAGATGLRTDPLLVGLTDEQRELLSVIDTHTTADARILWDETTDHRPGWNWSALLPVFTGRAYLGGLDPDAGTEFSFCGLRDGRLNGRPVGEWTDAELAEFCRWYNVGWVVCRTADAADRWKAFPGAKPVARLAEGGRPVVVYSLDRPKSFVLTGTATWAAAGPDRVSLTDVAPDADGWVTLSLHHLDGLRAYPSYVEIRHWAADPTGRDPLPHVRLRPHGPVPRVTLVWGNP